ncbi:hypothetical protein KM043_000783 [Ampulex compressa]|nr:hypothetical protein KM043_000783 [Ampulex compressa]
MGMGLVRGWLQWGGREESDGGGGSVDDCRAGRVTVTTGACHDGQPPTARGCRPRWVTRLFRLLEKLSGPGPPSTSLALASGDRSFHPRPPDIGKINRSVW